MKLTNNHVLYALFLSYSWLFQLSSYSTLSVYYIYITLHDLAFIIYSCLYQMMRRSQMFLPGM